MDHGKPWNDAQAMVTAGFTCPPVMCPIAYIIIDSTIPNASATPTSVTLPPEVSFTMIAPQPTKISANVAMASATTYTCGEAVEY